MEEGWRGKIYLADKLHLVPLNVLDDQYVQLGQEMQAQVGDGVAQNGLLDEQHVALGLLDLLHHVQQVLPLLLQDFVHLPVVVHNDLVLHLKIATI